MRLSGVNKEPVENEFLKLDEKWGEQYPVVVRSWQENWDKLSEYFQYTPAIRKLILAVWRLAVRMRTIRILYGGSLESRYIKISEKKPYVARMAYFCTINETRIQ